jgi:hypothetical protein
VPTATATSTNTATLTATLTATATPSATATSTDTPDGGVPTPTLPPNTCDGSCTDIGPPPDCTPLAATGDPMGGEPEDLIVDACLVVSGGTYVFHYVNVLDDGVLFFEDKGEPIDFRASSILVQKGGLVKAGSWCCPFGSYGGQLDIGLWGSDPTDQGTQPPATPGIGCVDILGHAKACFPPNLIATPHYCTKENTDDPCSSETPPPFGNNALFEGQIDHGSHAGSGGLPFDEGAAFGYKVLGVAYGGSLELFGAKGVAPADRVDPMSPEGACPVPPLDAQNDPAAWAALSGQSWARLDATAPPDSDSITLDRAVDWEQGDRLVVTTTDWHASHNEEVIISGVEAGTSAFTLSVPLQYNHNGEVYDVRDDIAAPPSDNQQVETRAAVGLLTRDIRVYSLGDTYDAPFPAASECGYQGSAGGDATTPGNCYFGGHVITRQGFANFQLQGVEFDRLGQGGRLAHYPVHWHMTKSTAYTNSFLKDSSIHDSMNRFVTVHATHNVTVARNVGFRSIGHGYYIEDGSEIDNRLCHNLAASVQGSLVEYFLAQDPDSPTHRFSPPILASLLAPTPTNTPNGTPNPTGSGTPTPTPTSSLPPFGSDSYYPVGFWMMNTWNDIVGNQVAGVGGFGSCYWLLGAGVSGPSLDLTWSTGMDEPASAGYAGYNQASTRQAPLKRFRGNGCSTAQYALQTTLQVEPASFGAQFGYTPAMNPYDIPQDMLPLVAGDYLPVLINGTSCATQRTALDTGGNKESCALTLIDRFSTSFNWASANFGAVWLRPQFFAFTNGAVTDQLFGGLTFVSGGAWTQAPPGYFTVTKDSIYSGSTQQNVAEAGPFGPSLDVGTCTADACPLPIDGTATLTGGFQPKRLINIYDGPFFADGNAFTNAPAMECDPMQVTAGNPQCGIYMSTVQPQSCAGLPSIEAPGTDGGMCVLAAAVGWKQPNGFFYPPAFAFQNTAFDDDTVRHNVIDQYNAYIQGTPTSPAAPMKFAPLQSTYTGVTPIDSSTILNDLDGTFTGMCWGDGCDSLNQPDPQRRTSSVSANHFFDAPSQAPECRSYGVQTSPGEFLTTVIAPLTSDGSAIDPTAWGQFPAVPIYRQRLLDGEMPCSGPVCGAGSACDTVKDTAAWSCDSAGFMMGAENGQAPYLTADGGVYYIDTDSTAQTTNCIACPNSFSVPTFGSTTDTTQYVVYQLFAKDDSKVTYQFYTGESGNTPNGYWAWVLPHEYVANAPNSMVVTKIPAGDLLTALNANVSLSNGVVEATFDSSLFADQFKFTARNDDEKCIPRDACRVGPSGEQCLLADDFAEPDLAPTVRSICETWATRVAGTTPISQGLSLSDCPASGCLGYVFSLDEGFAGQSYATAGAPLATCFPGDAQFDRPLEVISQDVSACTAPPAPAGFCSGPMPTPTWTSE